MKLSLHPSLLADINLYDITLQHKSHFAILNWR